MVALLGRPNSGKSTLVNAVIGEDLCVVTSLPQTTRRNLRGIYNDDTTQIVFVDTPGIHGGGRKVNEAMVNESRSLLRDKGLDAVGYVVDLGREFGAEEDSVAELVATARVPVLVVFNKTDRCEDIDARVAAFGERYPALRGGLQIRVQATGDGARETFLRALTPMLPEGPPLFPTDELTDENLRFFAAEFVRKGIILNTQKEVPHASCVEVLTYRETPSRHRVDAAIHVETVGQRGIVVGKGGAVIKKIRRVAEQELAKLSGVPATVNLHVKVSPRWRDKPGFLRGMGYRDL